MLKWGKPVSSYTYPKLGRWKIDHDVKIINIKIDQANYDNGGMYFENIENIKNIEKEKEKNEFLAPYCI
jgi:hypothetical protein